MLYKLFKDKIVYIKINKKTDTIIFYFSPIKWWEFLQTTFSKIKEDEIYFTFDHIF